MLGEGIAYGWLFLRNIAQITQISIGTDLIMDRFPKQMVKHGLQLVEMLLHNYTLQVILYFVG